MALTSQILATTLEDLVAKYSDATMVQTPFFKAVKDAGNFTTDDGGGRIRVPVVLKDHSQGTALVTGYEALNMAVQNPLSSAVYDFAHVVKPITISNKDELENRGNKAIVNYLNVLVKQTVGSLLRDMESQIFAGTSAFSGELQSLNGDAGGAFEAVAFGSQVNTVGGLSKAANPTTWQNQWLDGSGSVTIEDFQQVLLECRAKSDIGAGPDLMFLSTGALAKYSSLLSADQRYTSLAAAKELGGRVHMMFAGDIPVYQTPQLDGVVYAPSGINKALSGYLLDSSMLHVRSLADAFLTLGEMYRMTGYSARAADVYAATQVAIGGMNTSAILTGF